MSMRVQFNFRGMALCTSVVIVDDIPVCRVCSVLQVQVVTAQRYGCERTCIKGEERQLVLARVQARKPYVMKAKIFAEVWTLRPGVTLRHNRRRIYRHSP